MEAMRSDIGDEIEIIVDSHCRRLPGMTVRNSESFGLSSLLHRKTPPAGQRGWLATLSDSPDSSGEVNGTETAKHSFVCTDLVHPLGNDISMVDR